MAARGGKVFNRDIQLTKSARITKVTANGVIVIMDENGNIDAPLTTTDLTTSGTTTLGDSNDATQINGPTTVGVDDTGYDVKFFGATSGKSWLWDESADKMIVTGASDLLGNVQVTGTLTVGVDGTGHDVKLFGDTANKFVVWDQSADDLILADAVALQLGGDESTADGFKLEFDGTDSLDLDALTANDKFTIGSNTSTDVIITTAGGTATVDASANTLTLTGVNTVVTAGASIASSVATVIAPFIPVAVQQALSGAGVVDLTSYYTAVTNTGADALTLADSTVVGQLKKVKMIVDPGTDSTLTFNTNATIVFADVGDYALLMWNGSDWLPIELGNDADGATAPVYTPAS